MLVTWRGRDARAHVGVRRRAIGAAWALVILAVPTGAALAAPLQQDRPAATPPGIAADARVLAESADVASRLNCPLCQGYSLRDCPLVVCAQMRQLIVDKVAAGESEDQIVAYFVAQYGTGVLNEPQMSGFQLAAWIVPFLVLGAAVLVGVFYLRGRKPAVAPKMAVSDHETESAAAERLEAMVEDR